MGALVTWRAETVMVVTVVNKFEPSLVDMVQGESAGYLCGRPANTAHRGMPAICPQPGGRC